MIEVFLVHLFVYLYFRTGQQDLFRRNKRLPINFSGGDLTTQFTYFAVVRPSVSVFYMLTN